MAIEVFLNAGKNGRRLMIRRRVGEVMRFPAHRDARAYVPSLRSTRLWAMAPTILSHRGPRTSLLPRHR